jgi:hypothetical protein
MPARCHTVPVLAVQGERESGGCCGCWVWAEESREGNACKKGWCWWVEMILGCW